MLFEISSALPGRFGMKSVGYPYPFSTMNRAMAFCMRAVSQFRLANIIRGGIGTGVGCICSVVGAMAWESPGFDVDALSGDG